MSHTDDALAALQLLAAMYPLDGELELSDGARSALAASEAFEELPSGLGPIDVSVRVSLESTLLSSGSDTPLAVVLAISLPLDAPARIAVRQPSWLPRAEFSALEESLPVADSDDGSVASDIIMAAIEAVQARGTQLADQLATRAREAQEAQEAKDAADTDSDPGPLCRVWLWLPGLETREKRRDLVVYAPSYNLTGFVLAGKPGLICLEGGGKAVDRYMAVIKSESWGDVPSFQKKVTERLRRPLAETERKFTEMTDITNIVPHYGRYNHRGDMSEVKRLMDEWGVGDDFGAAVMNIS